MFFKLMYPIIKIILLYYYRKLYWADQGGFGVPPKIGKINMDGSNPQVLINDGHTPEAIAIDLEQKNIYYSTQYPSNVNYNISIYFISTTNKISY